MTEKRTGRPSKPADELRRKRHISVEDPLWDNFIAKHGKGRVSSRIRELMLEDLSPAERPAQTERAA